MTVRRVSLLVSTVVGMLMLNLPAGSARGASSPTGPVGTITVVSQPFSIAASANARFVIDASSNATIDPRDRLTFEVHRRVASRASLDAIVKGDANAAIIDSVSFPLSSVPRDSDGNLAPFVSFVDSINNSISLRLPMDGVYPLTIEVRDDKTGSAIASVMTFIDKRRASTSTTSVPVSVFARLGAEPSFTPDGQVQISDPLRAEVRAFVQLLGDTNRPVTIAVQPETVAALGSSADPQDVVLFNELHDVLRDRSITTSTFAQVDVSLFATLGLQDEFINQLRLGENTLNRFLPGVRIQRDTWVSDTPISKAGVSLLRKAGISGLILLAAAQSNLDAQEPLSILARPDGRNNAFLSVISADARAGELMDGPHPVPIDVAHGVAASLLMQRDDLVNAGKDPSSIRLVLSSTSGEVTGYDLAVAARALAQSPGVDILDASTPQTLTDRSPVIVFAESSTIPDAALAARLAGARSELDAVSSMTSDEDSRSDTWSYLLGIGMSNITPDTNAYVSGLRAALRDVRAAVTVTTPDKISLSGHSGSIRLQIRNNSKQQLTVRVRIYSPKLNLTEPNRVVVLTANGTTDVVIPATTRTNGQFPISLRVSTPEGNVEVVPYLTITARVTALAGLGQLVSISLLLVLLAWWWSHSRRARAQSA